MITKQKQKQKQVVQSRSFIDIKQELISYSISSMLQGNDAEQKDVIQGPTVVMNTFLKSHRVRC